MDWSDDEEEEEKEIEKPTRAKRSTSNAALTDSNSTTAVALPATVSHISPSSGDAPAGRSSPVRCRNIPKKDRREIVFEEFEPKISPNRTEVPPTPGQPTVINTKTSEDASESTAMEVVVDVEPIVVQKKKKAAIERLSQQTEESSVKNSNAQDNNSRATGAITSCFDFEDEAAAAAPPPQSETVQVKKNGNKTVDEEDVMATKQAAKDDELLAEIGNILNSTSDLVTVATTPAEILPRESSVSPLKANLSEMSLPPKERGKRIFKSRNNAMANETINEASVEVINSTGVEESKVAVVTGEVLGDKKITVHDVKEDVSPPKIIEAEQNDQKESETQENIVKDIVLKKRKLDEDNSDTVEMEPLQMTSGPEKKARLSCSSPVDIRMEDEEETTKTEIDSENKVIDKEYVEVPMDVKKEEVSAEKEKTQVQLDVVHPDNIIEEGEDQEVAIKPKINNNNNGNAESEPEATTITDKLSPEKCSPPRLSPEVVSPIKTNDLLSGRSVQKVQIVQMVRAPDGSEATETKVAKISAAESANVLTVAITQSGSVPVSSSSVGQEDISGSPVPMVEAEESTQNGSVALVQVRRD